MCGLFWPVIMKIPSVSLSANSWREMKAPEAMREKAVTLAMVKTMNLIVFIHNFCLILPRNGAGDWCVESVPTGDVPAMF